MMNKEMKNIKLAVITGIAAEFILCMAFFLFGKVPFGGWSSGSNVLGAFTVAFHSPGGFLFKILNIITIKEEATIAITQSINPNGIISKTLLNGE